MQFLRRAPEVLHLRVGYGLPEREQRAPSSAGAGATPGSARGAASAASACLGGGGARAWVAVAELEWSAADDPGAALRKLRQLQASVRADQPKARRLAPRRDASRPLPREGPPGGGTATQQAHTYALCANGVPIALNAAARRSPARARARASC
jgi:hypothetical protein